MPGADCPSCQTHQYSSSLGPPVPGPPPPPHTHTDWPWPPTMPGADCPSCQTHQCSSSLGPPVPEHLPLEQSLHLTPSPWTESPGKRQRQHRLYQCWVPVHCVLCPVSRKLSTLYKIKHARTHVQTVSNIYNSQETCKSNMKNNNSDALNHENSVANCLHDASVNHLHKLHLFCIYIIWT